MTIRVLIIDDSPTMRALLQMLLDREPDIAVVGTAASAREGRSLIRELNPDVVTLDIEMPEMNGLEFLEKIMRLRPMPVIIVSSLTQRGTQATMRALELGAVDCYAKPDGAAGDLARADAGRLAQSIRAAARVQVVAATHAQVDNVARETVDIVRTARGHDEGAIIAIGASTGGVEALHNVLRRFPADCPPTLIVQHINGQFAPAMAARLDGQCAPRVLLAEPDLPIRPGHVYVAPGNDKHLTVRGGATPSCRLRPGDPVSGHRPSIDALFASVAESFPRKAVGVLLTGMGADGAEGLLAMRRAGCRTIAQDEASCVVYGMPKVAVELGAAEYVVPLPRIADKALTLVAA
jgi:two-component system chemotaxis response regulator CheB